MFLSGNNTSAGPCSFSHFGLYSHGTDVPLVLTSVGFTVCGKGKESFIAMHPEVAKVLQCWGAHRYIGSEQDIQQLPTKLKTLIGCDIVRTGNTS